MILKLSKAKTAGMDFHSLCLRTGTLLLIIFFATFPVGSCVDAPNDGSGSRDTVVVADTLVEYDTSLIYHTIRGKDTVRIIDTVRHVDTMYLNGPDKAPICGGDTLTWTLSGMVLDSADSLPIGNAHITAFSADSRHSPITVATDTSRGLYQINGLTGCYRILCSALNYRPQEVFVRDSVDNVFNVYKDKDLNFYLAKE